MEIKYMNKEKSIIKFKTQTNFIKKFSFWIFMLLILNLSIFFAFTQDYYYQKHVSLTKNIITINDQNLLKSTSNMNLDIDQLSLDIQGVNSSSDCENIRLLTTRTLPKVIEPFEVFNSSISLKNKEIEVLSNKFKSTLSQETTKIDTFNSMIKNLTNLNDNSTALTSLCFNYYKVKNNASYQRNDLILFQKMSEDLESLSIDHNGNSIYFKSIGESLDQLSKDNNLNTLSDTTIKMDQKAESKSKLITLYKSLIVNIINYDILIQDIKVQKVDNLKVTNFKNELITKTNEIDKRTFWQNILKINFL